MYIKSQHTLRRTNHGYTRTQDGQVVLAFPKDKNRAALVDSAVVSGVSIDPPNERAGWEMSRMMTDQETIEAMVGNIHLNRMEDMATLQGVSLRFDLGLRLMLVRDRKASGASRCC